MKKVVLLVTCFAVGFLAYLYIAIPSEFVIARTGSVNCSFSAAKRFIFEDSNWSAWHGSPDKSNMPSKTPFNARITNTFYLNTGVTISDGTDSTESGILLVAYNADSTGIEWRDTISISKNPFTRVQQFRRAKRFEQFIQSSADSLFAFLGNKQKVYGQEVFQIQERDRPLLSRRIVVNHEPSSAEAYDLIESVRNFAKSQGDPGDSSAMKYVSQLDSINYELIVAIPTTTMLRGTKEFIPKGLVGGNPIAMEFRGGEHTIYMAWKGIRQYMHDYRLSSPAIPYEIMLVDRQKQPDTTKWRTRIVYPTRL